MGGYQRKPERVSEETSSQKESHNFDKKPTPNGIVAQVMQEEADKDRAKIAKTDTFFPAAVTKAEILQATNFFEKVTEDAQFIYLQKKEILPEGTPIQVMATSQLGWFKVTWGNKEGYVLYHGKNIIYDLGVLQEVIVVAKRMSAQKAEALAGNFYETVNGLGTNEEGLKQVLAQIAPYQSEFYRQVAEKYQIKYSPLRENRNLLQEILEELSGSHLQDAFTILNFHPSEAEQAQLKAPDKGFLAGATDFVVGASMQLNPMNYALKEIIDLWNTLSLAEQEVKGKAALRTVLNFFQTVSHPPDWLPLDNTAKQAWPILAHIQIGFLEHLLSLEGAAFTKPCLVLMNAYLEPAFMRGMLVGTVEGIANWVIDLVGMVKMLGELLWYFSIFNLPEQIKDQKEIAEKIHKAAGALYANKDKIFAVLLDFFTNPASQEEMLRTLAQMRDTLSKSIGKQIATALMGYLDKPYDQMGEGLGKIIGYILPEILLAVGSEGIGTLLKNGAEGLKALRAILEGSKLTRAALESAQEGIRLLKALGGKLKAETRKMWEELVDALDELIGLQAEMVTPDGMRIKVPREKLPNKHILKMEKADEVAGGVKKTEKVVEQEGIINNKFPEETLPTNGFIKECKIKDGLLVDKEGKFINGEFDFVIKENGEFIIGKKHHLLGDRKPVKAAGNVKIQQGRIRRIDNQSGHYRPTAQETLKFPDIFEKSGIDIKSAVLERYSYEVDAEGFIIKQTREKTIFPKK